MKRILISIYKNLFVKKVLYNFHHRLLNISLWGLGVLNSENDYLSGEDHFLRHLMAFINVQNDFVVFDVGANVGNYANKVRHIHPNAQIYAFDPAPTSFQVLNTNALKYEYKAFNMAMSNFSGRMLFYNRGNGSSEHSSLFREVITEIHNDPNFVQLEVPVSTVDEFAAEYQLPHIHLLKIDTEGNDLNVLLGAQEILTARAIDVIQFEFNTMNVVSRVFFRDFHLLLKGYKFYRLLPDGLVRLDSNPTFLSEIFAFQNIVAVRDNI